VSKAPASSPSGSRGSASSSAAAAQPPPAIRSVAWREVTSGKVRRTVVISALSLALLMLAGCASHQPSIPGIVKPSDTSEPPQHTQINTVPTATEQSPAPAVSPSSSRQHRPVTSPPRCLTSASFTIADNAAPSNLPLQPKLPGTVCLRLNGTLRLRLGLPSGGGTWPTPLERGQALRRTGLNRSGGRVVATFAARKTGNATVADEIGFEPGPSTAFTIRVTVVP